MNYKVNDTVYFYYDERIHKGKIIEIVTGVDYPIKVQTESGDKYTFAHDGYFDEDRLLINRLSFTPFEITLEGATYERPEEKPKEAKEEKTFPRMMWVWDGNRENPKQTKSIVLGIFNNYAISVNDNFEEEFESGDKYYTSTWRNCAEIEEELNISIEEAKKIIAEAKGVDVEQVKINVS